jgi:hypothetical protein
MVGISVRAPSRSRGRSPVFQPIVPVSRMRIAAALWALFAYLQAQDWQAVALPDALEA